METGITQEKINILVGELPSNYIKALARECFGKATKSHIRQIKYWRSGEMKDRILSNKIYQAGQKLKQKCIEAAA